MFAPFEAATAFEQEMSQHWDTLEKIVERQAKAGQGGKALRRASRRAPPVAGRRRAVQPAPQASTAKKAYATGLDRTAQAPVRA